MLRCEEAHGRSWRCTMSDKIITLNDHMKEHAGRSRDQEPTPINARFQWLAYPCASHVFEMS
jgi:hypothetical protein